MGHKKKYLLIISTIVLCFFYGIYNFLSQNFSQDKVIHWANRWVTTILPGYNFSVEKVEYQLGPIFLVSLKNISVKNSNQKLLQISHLDFKIPYLAFFSSGQEVALELSKVSYRIIDYKNINLTKILDLGEKLRRNLYKDNHSAESSYLNSLLRKNNIGLRFYEVKIVSEHKISHKIFLKKIVLKNLHLNNSVFEVLASLNELIPNAGDYNGDLLLIGHLNLSDIGQIDKEMISIILQVDNLVDSSHNILLPQIKYQMNLHLDNHGEAFGEVKGYIAQEGKFYGNYSLGRDGLIVNKINAHINGRFLKRTPLAKVINVKLFSKSKFELKGSLKVSNGIFKPNLIGNFDRPLKIQEEKLKFDNLMPMLHLIGDKAHVSAKGSWLKGVIDTNGEFLIDYKDLLMGKMTLIPLNFNVKLEKNVVDMSQYNNLKNEIINYSEKFIPNVNHSYRLGISMDDLHFLGKPLSGSCLILVSSDILGLKNSNFHWGSGTLSSDFLFHFNTKKNLKGRGYSNFENFDLNLMSKILSLKNDVMSGKLSGNIYGFFTRNEEHVNYLGKFNFSILNGNFKKFPVNKSIIDFIRDIEIKKGELDRISKNFKYGQYNLVSLEGEKQKNHFKFNNIYWESKRDKVKFKGHGQIYPKANKNLSYLYLNLDGKKLGISGRMRKLYGLDNLPMMWVGKGYSLKPRKSYTFQTLTLLSQNKNLSE